MKNKKVSLPLTALLLLSAAPTHIEAKNKDENSLLFSAIGITALGACVYALYNYLSESDEDVLDNGYRKLIAYKNDYSIMSTALTMRLKECDLTTKDSHYAQDVDEKLLYALATKKHNQATITVYRSQLSSALRDLKFVYDELTYRIKKQKDVLLQDRMRNTTEQLKTLIDTLSLLDRICAHHEAYFLMYETESKTGIKYADEFKVLTDYYGNQEMQANATRHYIITQSGTSSLPFPRVEYLKRIERDIKSLDKIIKRATHNYQDRTSSALHYLATLKTIKSYIITDALYNQEITNYERDQREKERIRIEREKADTERRKADAAERQACAEQEKAWAKQREARAKEEENRIRERENRMNRINQTNGNRQTVHMVHHQ